MAAVNPNPFSIRPIKAPSDRKPKNLPEFIARINSSHPGGFRCVSQAALQKEVEERKQKQNADPDTTDALMGEGEGDGSEEEPEAEAVKDVRAARDEVLRNIEVAHRNAMLTLDFVSLWMSKEVPSTQVIGTLTPQLRQIVGIGTVGSTKVHEPLHLEQRLQENTVISTGSKLLAINKTADTLLTAASRLQKEMTVETKYWQSVLAVSEGGWPVARRPHDPRTMAVKFGFSDSTAEFQANSWAAMHRADDGSVDLKTGRLVVEPKRVVVSLERDGKVFGRSSIPQPLPSDAPLEARVQEARNTILAQELWHEINREARSLLSYNVRLQPASVCHMMADNMAVKFTLVTLGGLPELDAEPESHSGDASAEAVCIALYLLLAYAHRQNARRKTQLLPLSTDQARLPKPAYSIVRPVITSLQHEVWLRNCVRFVSDLTAVLRSAGIATAGYTVQEFPLPQVASENASEQLLNALLRNLSFRIELTITPQARFEIVAGTGSTQWAFSFVRCTLLPAIRTQNDTSGAPPDQATHLLFHAYPPADFYKNPKDVFRYLSEATTRVLAKHFETRAAEWMATAPQTEKYPPVWITTIRGDAVRDRDTESRGVSFELLTSTPSGVGHTDEADSVDGLLGKHTDTGLPASAAAPTVTELQVVGQQLDGKGEMVSRTWSWKLEDVVQGASAQNGLMEDAVRLVLAPEALEPGATVTEGFLMKLGMR